MIQFFKSKNTLKNSPYQKAVLKYDGEYDSSAFRKSNLYGQLNRFSHLAVNNTVEEAQDEILKRVNDKSYLKFMNVRSRWIV